MTQRERLLQAFRRAPNNTLSMQYIERELMLSQGNARLKELKEQGYKFEDAGKDKHGFKLHRLIEETDKTETGKPKLQFGNSSQIYALRHEKKII